MSRESNVKAKYWSNEWQMRIVPSLRCLVCETGHLALEEGGAVSSKRNDMHLECAACGKVYAIEDGIIIMYNQLDAATHREMEARDARKYDWEVERKRPYIYHDYPEIHRDDSEVDWDIIASNVEQILSLLQLNGMLAGRRVLEIGAGTCWATRMLAERGGICTALDISAVLLKVGEAQFSPGSLGFDRLATDMNNMPFQDAQFDVVFCNESIHHSDDLQKSFGEIWRVLAKNGICALVNEPTKSHFQDADSWGADAKEHGMNEHIHSLSEYITAARAAGFSVQVLFPESLSKQLAGKSHAPNTFRFKIAQKLVPGFIWGYFLPVLYRFLALPLVLLLRKEGP